MQNKFRYTNLISNFSTLISALITLTIVFTLTFASVFGILSLKEYNTQAENRNQIIIYLNDLDANEKKDFSKKLLELPGISSIRYESKELAIKALILELGINLSENENPLNDAFYVYLKKDVNLDHLKESLVNMTEISAFDFRTNAIQNGLKFNEDMSSFVRNATIVMALFTILMIYNIIKFSIKSKNDEIIKAINSNTKVSTLKRFFFIEEFIQITISFILAIVLYGNIKLRVIDNINLIIPTYNLQVSQFKEVMVIILIYVISIVLAAFINYISMHRYFKKTIGDSNVSE
ncbi:cell division protein FtsX [Oceanivirga miroungae]|uniref:FtsX extracellular domain-containing protein n=1 Tax=Oceanivirga miroungae TaxID=1130046 RepID=A0A6I8M5U8_9FUSO|nr:permease-like cell division protein FtsX [Oceanivirga miroungae]VWL84762.1 hypothetical protein OMES3154_00010 [Oceanivirga miroungae]